MNVNLQEIWFDNNDPIERDADLVLYYQVAEQMKEAEPFATLIIDLGESEEEIYKNFAKNNRYEISRAEKRDELTAQFFNYPVPQKVLESLCEDYNSFAESRHKTTLTPKVFHKLNEDQMLAVTNVVRNGKVLVWHTYIVNHGRARLKTSNSIFTDKSNEERNLIGRANRFLHWEDIKFFRNKQYKTYDFGGFYTGELDKKLLGINSFKKSFGGTLEESFNYAVTKTLKGKIYLALARLKKKLR